VDSRGRTIWIVDAHRDDGKRFVVRADDKLSAFVELERQFALAAIVLDEQARFSPDSEQQDAKIARQQKQIETLYCGPAKSERTA
jgi:hypothetical protein